jgi:hypothetical protein
MAFLVELKMAIFAGLKMAILAGCKHYLKDERV